MSDLAIKLDISSRSQMSPPTKRTGPHRIAASRFAGRPRTMSSITMISAQPSSTSRSTMWEPIKPAPPVTRTRLPWRSAIISPIWQAAGSVDYRLVEHRHDFRHLFETELGINRQREEAFGDRLGHRKLAAPVTEIFVRLLKMHRDGVVDAGHDPGVAHPTLHGVALGDLDGVDVEHMPTTRRRARPLVAAVRQQSVILRRDRPSR